MDVIREKREDEAVSNPLGWDGDLIVFRSVTVTDGVSNPLGWDGDSICFSTASQVSRCF